MKAPKKKVAELVLAGFLVLFGLFVILEVRTYNDPMATQYLTLRSTFAPTLWASILGVLGLLYFGSVIFQLRNTKREDEREIGDGLASTGQKIIFRRIVVSIIALISYSLVLGLLPFWLITTVFLSSMFYNFGQRKFKVTVPLSLVVGVVAHLMFVTAMHIPL